MSTRNWFKVYNLFPQFWWVSTDQGAAPAEGRWAPAEGLKEKKSHEVVFFFFWFPLRKWWCFIMKWVKHHLRQARRGMASLQSNFTFSFKHHSSLQFYLFKHHWCVWTRVYRIPWHMANPCPGDAPRSLHCFESCKLARMDDRYDERAKVC